MTAGRALARLAIASLPLIFAGAAAVGACRRKAPAFKTLPEPHTSFPLTVGPDPGPLLTEQKLPPELHALVDRAHAHPAAGTLEAAGCDVALVMTGADYNRFVDLRHGTKMPSQVTDAREQVVYCQRRMSVPPDCAALAPIFARVAHPSGRFLVLSGYVDPPFAPRCSGEHDAKGRFLSGEGPGYPSARLQ